MYQIGGKARERAVFLFNDILVLARVKSALFSSDTTLTYEETIDLATATLLPASGHLAGGAEASDPSSPGQSVAASQAATPERSLAPTATPRSSLRAKFFGVGRNNPVPEHAFLLSTPSSLLTLVAPSTEERTRWVTMITQVIEAAGGRASP